MENPKLKEHKEKLVAVIEGARKDDIIIECVLNGNKHMVRPDLYIREKTAEEKLAELQKEVKTEKKATKKK